MRGIRGAALALGATAALLLASGCSAGARDVGSTEASSSDTLHVYATTGYIADAVANIAPNAEVTTMVGPGGDPHTYQPSTREIKALFDADVVLWNGLELEAQMVGVFAELGDRQLAVAEQLLPEHLISSSDGDEQVAMYDPHVWNSPDAWIEVLHVIAERLGEADEANAATYVANAETYAREIADAAAEARELLSHIDAPRVVVTGHDAFAYFGREYDLEIYATDFISSEAQLSPTELAELADLITDRQVPVIFHDNQANPQAIESLMQAVQSRGWKVRVSEHELYADSLGADTDVNTYLNVFLHNAAAIASELTSTGVSAAANSERG